LKTAAKASCSESKQKARTAGETRAFSAQAFRLKVLLSGGDQVGPIEELLFDRLVGNGQRLMSELQL
jgi:hypothetical protein